MLRRRPRRHHRRHQAAGRAVARRHREQDRRHLLLANLVERGLDFSEGILCVVDGAKALAAGVHKVFGEKARVQRCTLHKRRNLKDHLPKELGETIDKRLAVIFAQPDANKGLDAARRLASELQGDHPDAAASLREGLEEMFTARRLERDPAARQEPHQYQLHRVDDLRRPAHDRPRDALEGRLDEEALGRRRDARSRAVLSTDKGL